MEVGALTSGPTDQLTTVDQVDPIYVYFNPSDQDVLAVAAGHRRQAPGAAQGRARRPGHAGRRQRASAQTGKLNFIALALQPSTGALQLRAEFPNPQHTLLPGQFVRVRLLGLKRNDAILVPQRAVLAGPERALRLRPRRQQQGQRPAGERHRLAGDRSGSSTSGLRPGDKVDRGRSPEDPPRRPGAAGGL